MNQEQYEQTRDYRREELTAIADRLEWETCIGCGREVTSACKGIDFFDVVKAAGLDDMRLPTGSGYDGKRKCHDCSTKASNAREAKLVPRYARKLASQVHATFICPMCDEQTSSKLLLKCHIMDSHDSFRLEEHLHIKHRLE